MLDERRPLWALPHWIELINALPEGERVTPREAFEANRAWWPRSEGQLAFALRKMATAGLIAKPRPGLYVRREGSMAFENGAVHLSLSGLFAPDGNESKGPKGTANGANRGSIPSTPSARRRADG